MPKQVFCNEGCKESYREDRQAGLIYGQIALPDGRIVGWDQGCAELGICPYCTAKLDNPTKNENTAKQTSLVNTA